jgi:hypothetical protein
MAGSALVCGYGSVGKLYSQVASKFYSEVYVFDENQNIPVPPPLKHLTQIVNSSERFDIAILATPAPRRFELASLVSPFARRLICEKLLFSNLLDFDRWAALAEAREICLTGRWEVLNLKCHLSDVSRRFNMGRLTSMRVTGGNCCLSTGGAHWLSFFFSYFDNSPLGSSGVHVNYDVALRDFNPRGNNMKMLDGTISISSDEIDFSMSFDHDSRMPATCSFYFERGLLVLEQDGTATVNYYKSEPQFRHLAHYLKTDASEQVIIPNVSSYIEQVLINASSETPVSFTNGFTTSALLAYIGLCARNNGGISRDTFTLYEILRFLEGISDRMTYPDTETFLT